MRTLDKIKYDYLDSFTYTNPTKEEIDYYKITDDLLKKWRTQERLSNKKEFYNQIIKLNNYDKLELENKQLISTIFYLFVNSTNDYATEDFYYYEILPIFKTMYENDIFDILTYENNRKQLYLGNISKPDPRSFPIQIYAGRKYVGIIPNLYYSNHLDVFDDVIKYFANVIFKKYGLYLQKAMNIIIEFCKEYNLPYVDLLNKAKEDAKKLNYPSNHEFKYQFDPRINVEWEN